MILEAGVRSLFGIVLAALLLVLLASAVVVPLQAFWARITVRVAGSWVVAMEKKEYSWAAQLVNYLYRLDPTDEEVRQRKAEALRQMAYVSTGANNRAHLISQALTLEGKVTLPRNDGNALTGGVGGGRLIIRSRINPAASERRMR